MRSFTRYYIILSIIVIALFLANICFGTITISIDDLLGSLTGKGGNETNDIIILNSRLPQAITALFSGAALAVSGLMLQTLFNNPLAAPSILGVSSGAGVGVAVVMLLLGGNIAGFGIGGQLALVFGSMVGAMSVLITILLFSLKVKNSVMLLIIGIMVGYIATSVVSLLSYMGTTEGVYTFVMWGMGDFSAVSSSNINYFVGFILLALAVAFSLTKSLNGLLLGENYCENLGINTTRARVMILISTGILTSVVTAFCGPISFLGLATPHIARLLIGSSNHRALLPVTTLIGSAMALMCNLISTTAGGGMLIPLNVITPFLGAPVIIYVVVNRDKIPYFNKQ
ncbi:MAG: iron ABC transporter permease [Rikenellaceae bacterium]